MKLLFVALVGLSLTSPAAERVVTSLSGADWTCDGAAVVVPHTWNAFDAADGRDVPANHLGTSVACPSYLRKCARYARPLPNPQANRRYFVRFEGVSSKAEVIVNGRLVGRHAGAYTAFAFEITEALRAQDNELVVLADNRLDRDVPPISGDFSLFGGIYRDVWLIETPQICISPLVYGGPGIRLEPDALTGVVTARIKVLGGPDEVQRFAVRNHRLWSPETPVVYTQRVEIASGDAVDVTFGFRSAGFEDGGFCLNGRKRLIRGVCRHQDRAGKGSAVSAADEAEDVAWLKRMGANGVRTSHYPQSTRFFDLCDENGIMVWTEIPAVDELSFTPAFRTNLLNVAREMVAQHANHPSVVMWGLFNEMYGQTGDGMPEGKVMKLLRETQAVIKEADPSRTVVSATRDAARRELNALTEELGFNLYPGWYDWSPWYVGGEGGEMSNAIRRVMAEVPGRSMIAISEYGGGGSIFQHGDPTMRCHPGSAVQTEEYQAYLHAGALKALAGNPRVWGIFPWCLFDLGADHRQETNCRGINTKGLVTYGRDTAKDAFYLYKANWNTEPELHLVGSRMTTVTNSVIHVLVFSNVGDVSLSVNGRLIARRTPDEVKCVHFPGVTLAEGTNVITVTAGKLSRRAVWVRTLEVRDETSYWQRKIDDCHARGGGVVAVPAGRHLVGQLDLMSNVELHLETGAVLEGLVGLGHYRILRLPYSEGCWSAVVSAVGVTNVAITGHGQIFGNGGAWPQPENYGGNQEGSRPRGLFFADSRGIRLEDFSLKDTASWGLVLKCCDGVFCRRLTIDNHANANNDGIDVEACNVQIESCDIDSGDDAVCLKSNNPQFTVENVVVSNVVARSNCNALKLGTASHGTMRNILFVDCRTEAPRRDFRDRRFGRNRWWYVNEDRAALFPGAKANVPSASSGLCVENVDGGAVENVTYRRIDVRGAKVPIFVRAGTRSGRSCGTPPSNHYVFRSITFEDITGKAESCCASSVTGVVGCRVKDVAFRNVSIECQGGGETAAERTRAVPELADEYPDAKMFGMMLPAFGLYVRHVDGLTLENTCFLLSGELGDERDAIVLHDCRGQDDRAMP